MATKKKAETKAKKKKTSVPKAAVRKKTAGKKIAVKKKTAAGPKAAPKAKRAAARRPPRADAATGRPARHRAHRRGHALLQPSRGRDPETRERQAARG